MEIKPHTSADPKTAIPPDQPSVMPSHTQDHPTPPPHTQMQSTLAPTSEYVRYLLLALPARYIPRGILGMVFDRDMYKGNRFASGMAALLEKPFAWLRNDHAKSASTLKQKNALAYNTILGVGSLALTASYSWTVYKDIKNIFCEAVGAELGKPATEVNFADLQRSDNRIVHKTMEFFWLRLAKRACTDLLFFPVAAMRSMEGGDIMIGVKAGQAFGETWKRKTTMFEDLLTFVNNKINPSNGLGQPISVGEIFDLYQHYAQSYSPAHAFKGVIEHASGEGTRWVDNQIIFQRITELMNKTYAYKHTSIVDPATGKTVAQANFALPTLIYLLGHDLIDINAPKQTLVAIEIANSQGIKAVQQMQAALKQGTSLDTIIAQFHITLPKANHSQPKPEEPNGVISKGSTVQLDQEVHATTPVSRIATDSIRALQPLVAQPHPQVAV